LQTGESHGAIVRRLVEHERERLRAEGVTRALVWTFPSYQAEADHVDTRIFYRVGSEEPRVFEGLGERLKPTPPKGSYVLIKLGGERLHGQLEEAELDRSGDRPILLISVRALNPQPRATLDVLDRMKSRLEQDPAYIALERRDNVVLNRALALGKYHLGAYLTEFMGDVKDPYNSGIKRFVGQNGTVDAENAALYGLGIISLERAVRKLDALKIGTRILDANSLFYLRLDADSNDDVYIAEARDC
jgi:hypothetical protein